MFAFHSLKHLKIKIMKTFIFKMYIRTKQGQEFIIGQSKIQANDCDAATKIFNNKDLPFHSFCTIECIKQ